jgi:hypothetical protein
MKWVSHAPRVKWDRVHAAFLFGNMTGRDNLGDQDVDGKLTATGLFRVNILWFLSPTGSLVELIVKKKTE